MRMRPRIAAAVPIVALVVVAATMPALAGPQVSVKDVSRDVAGPMDVVALSFGVAPDGRLRATVTMAGEWENGALLGGDGRPPGSICLRMWTHADPDGAGPDYVACATVEANAETLRGEILRPRTGHLPTLTGKGLLLSRPTGRSITMRFARTAIGSPPSVRVTVAATRAGCARLSCVDRAPEAPQTVALTISG